MDRINEKIDIKHQIIERTQQAKQRNLTEIEKLTDRVSLLAYRHLTREGIHGLVWTDALQQALWEHEVIVIPKAEEVYWLDNTVVIPSNRHIEADGAEIAVVPEYPYVMLTNEHIRDGTHAPIHTCNRDTNISIHGGCWNEGAVTRGERHFRGDRSTFYGVQTCMLFNNIHHLSITDVTFVRACSFCVQIGDITDGVFENFSFVSCYADGLHINGNCENLYIRNFSGHVGDDLVALNMYDWLGSSINYGPCRNVFCEDIHSSPDSPAKAMRLQPGIFTYQDGTSIDCSLSDMYFHRLSGMFEYKLYFQSPPYRLGQKPEGGGAGSADNLFFEDVEIISARSAPPPDDPVTGYFGMFYMNSNIGYISLDNIRYIKGENDSPKNYLVAVGPMSWRLSDGVWDYEIFDPYVSGTVDILDMKNIYINGRHTTDVDEIVKIIVFDDVDHDGASSGRGQVNHILMDGTQVR